MRSELGGSVPFSLAEQKCTSAITTGGKITLAEDVQADQRIEFERVGQLDANHLLEHEWIRCVTAGLVRAKTNAKCIAFDLPFPLCRLERSLAQTNQTQRLS